MSYIPIKIMFRKMTNCPIIEMKGSCKVEGKHQFLLQVALKIFEIAEKEGGRLIPSEPNEDARENQFFFTLIFQNEEKLEKFIRMLPYIK